MLGMQRRLGITQDYNVEIVFFASDGQKKQWKKTTERSRQAAAHYWDKNQFI